MQVIRASEINEYLYCARSWWLRRVAQQEPAAQERLDTGTQLHAQHGKTVQASRVLLFLSVLLFLAAVVATLGTF